MPASGRTEPFAVPSGNGRYLRLPPVHRANLKGQLRAESAPTRIASGRTGVRAIAVVPLQVEVGLTPGAVFPISGPESPSFLTPVPRPCEGLR